jgi:predicted AAA+ superfamily ATPase
MHELQKAKLVISGSNAKLLSRELGTLLTGRHLDITVFPLSFKEFLAFNQIVVKDRLDAVEKRIEIRSLLRKYLEQGSFPEVALSGQKKNILLSYFEDLLNKDLLRRFNIRKPQELKALVKFYLSAVATLMTFNSIEKFLKISGATVEKFSSYLEQAYLMFFLKRFSFKVKEQEKNPRKVYAVDTGLSNAVGFRFSENVGRLAENVVFLELKRRQTFNPDLELYYWKDIHHREVDFVVKEGTNITQLIQVCWSIDDAQTKERELRSLTKALQELKAQTALVITEDYEAEEQFRDRLITFTPLWKWLLD